MTLIYEGGKQSYLYWNHEYHKMATFGYNMDTEDMTKVNAVINELVEKGWNIDDGVQEWAGCEVYDREEFNLLMRDFRAAKRHNHIR